MDIVKQMKTFENYLLQHKGILMIMWLVFPTVSLNQKELGISLVKMIPIPLLQSNTETMYIILYMSSYHLPLLNCTVICCCRLLARIAWSRCFIISCVRSLLRDVSIVCLYYSTACMMTLSFFYVKDNAQYHKTFVT